MPVTSPPTYFSPAPHKPVSTVEAIKDSLKKSLETRPATFNLEPEAKADSYAAAFVTF